MNQMVCHACGRPLPATANKCPACGSTAVTSAATSAACLAPITMSRTALRLLQGTAIFLVLLNVVVLGLPSSATRPAVISPVHTPPVPAVFTDRLQRIQFSASSEWLENPTAVEGSVLCLQKPSQDLIVVVFSEPKSALGSAYANLDVYGEALRALLQTNIVDGKQATAVRLTIGGFPAVQGEITGSQDGVRLTFLHTVVEAPEAYYQIRAFTTSENFTAVRQQLLDVTASCRFPSLDQSHQ